MPESSTPALPTLAILGGTGKEGPGLALRWASAGYQVIIGSRAAEKAQATADDLNSMLGLASIRGMENGQAAREAQISILDEPTSWMDAQAEYQVFKFFRQLFAGRSVILISHRFSR